VKLAETIRFRGRCIQPQLGLFNLTNEDAILAMNNSFGPNLSRVRAVTDGRVVRLGVQVDF
jgi:hypothetical protein